MIKIYLRKAYDSIEWKFLEIMMIEMGFPRIFVDWVMKCVSTVSYSILLNGKRFPPFQATTGWRQGDPTSPFLFVIGMEHLSHCLDSLKDNKAFRFHPKCKRAGINRYYLQMICSFFAEEIVFRLG